MTSHTVGAPRTVATSAARSREWTVVGVGVEYERKFLVCSDGWRPLAVSSSEIWQGWIVDERYTHLRVRVRDGEVSVACKIELSGSRERRLEIEEHVDSEYGAQLRELCATWLEKTRWLVNVGGRVWEVDEYHGTLDGVVTAEIEDPDVDELLPDWVGEEVTDDARWSNAALARRGAAPGAADVSGV